MSIQKFDVWSKTFHQIRVREQETKGRLLAGILLILAIVLFLHLPAFSQNEIPALKHAPGVVLVKLRAQKSRAHLRSVTDSYELSVEEEPLLEKLGIYRIRIPERLLRSGKNEKSYAATLKNDSRQVFEFAEVDTLHESALTPNDALYSSQWHLPKISAPGAWDFGTGSPSLIIAILDTGINSSHPDLTGKLVPGWSVYDNTSNTSDAKGHGTMVAGIAAANSNNALGIAGVSWGSKIMPIKIAGANGCTYSSTIAAGLVWAADHGARVANISFSGLAKNPLVDIAAYYFQLHNGVVVGAAGISSNYWGSDDAYILSVNATDANDACASFCMNGDYVDISAPGVNITSTNLSGGYEAGDGLSYASPIVAGVAALVMSANPSLSPIQVIQAIKQTATDLGAPGIDPEFGTGRVNALAAVNLARSGTPIPSDTIPPTIEIISPTAGQSVMGSVGIRYNASDNIQLASINVAVDGVLIKVFTTPSSGGPNYWLTWDTSVVPNGQHVIRVEAVDTSFNASSVQVIVTVNNPVDTQPPNSLFFSCPRTNGVLSGARELELSTNGAVTAAVSVDGVASLATISAVAPFRFFWDTTTVSNGAHTLRADAMDMWGNTISREIPVTVRNIGSDVTAPAWGLLISPGGNSTTDDPTPTFRWSNISDPSGVTYRLRVGDTNTLFTAPIINVTGLTSPTYTPTTPLRNGFYYWTVESIDGAGNIEDCWAIGQFEISGVPNSDTTPPPTPTLSSPGNGATITNRVPSFDWTDVSDPSGVYYTFELDNNTDFSTVIYIDQAFTSDYGPMVLNGAPFPNGTYYWRVTPRDGQWNDGTPTPIRSFIISSSSDTTPPPAPTLSAPPNNIRYRLFPGTTFTFDWSDVSDPSGVLYKLIVSPGTQGRDTVLVSSYTIGVSNFPPLDDGSYTWQVQARDGAGNLGPLSTAGNFVVDTTGPAAPVLSLPADGGTVSNATPVFDWSDVSDPGGAVKYRIEITDNNFMGEVYRVNLTTSTYTPTTALAPGLHYWRVGTDDSLGNPGPLSARRSFRVPGDVTPPQAPTLNSPTNGSSTTSTSPSFSWNAVTDVNVKYRLQADNSGTTFPSPEVDVTNLSPTAYTASALAVGTYSWRVAATDSSGNQGAWSAVWSLGVGQTPVLTPVISSSSPGDGFIDPLQDKDPTNPTILIGMSDISITFSAAMKDATSSGSLTLSNFERRYFRGGTTTPIEVSAAAADLELAALGQPAATVTLTGSGAGPYILHFNPRVPLGAWTQVKAINVVSTSGTPISSTENRIVFGFLPMDITQDGKVLGDDINRWLAINGNSFDPAPLTKLQLLDQKRNGIIAGEDITRSIQLINGIGTFRVWSGYDLGGKPQ